MVRCVYGSKSEKKPGYHRVIPYLDDGIQITPLPTILTDQWVPTTGKYPWRREFKSVTEPTVECATDKELDDIVAECRAEEEEPDYEAKEIVNLYEGEHGKPLYDVKWKGFDSSHSTFHERDDLADCMELVKEFEKDMAPMAAG